MVDTFSDYSATLLDDLTLTPKSKTCIQPAIENDIFRYRYQHGVNLGSCFVLEKWLTPSMYLHGADTSELAAVTTSIKSVGVKQTRQQWEDHWATMLTDADLDWLANVAHCTCIRLPIGYFTLGPNACAGTPFAGDIASVYTNAWQAVKNLVARAYSRGIGTLIDMHGLPGGANNQDHSGTNSGKAEFWQNGFTIDLGTRCLAFIAQEISEAAMPGVVGLQVCNEASWQAPGMYQWYDRICAAIAQVDPTIPIYISDAWDLPQAVQYARSRNTLSRANANPIIIDSHPYWCFSEEDKAKSPEQIIASVPNKVLPPLNGVEGNVYDHGAVQLAIGEYSNVIDPSSWHKSPTASRPALIKQFGQAQSQIFQQKAAGAFFWTLKMDWMPGGEWGFVEQCNSGAITAPTSLLLSKAAIDSRMAHASSVRDQRKHDDISSHVKYWYEQAPSARFEHKKYEEGWDWGFADAMKFFCWRTGFGGTAAAGKVVSADKIGAMEVWVRKRMIDAGMTGEKFAWEWETGFRKGASVFYEVIGV